LDCRLHQLPFFFAVWMIFRLGRRLFDEPVAWVSAAAFAGSDLFWRFSISGQSTLLLIVLMLGLAEVLARLEPRRDKAPRGVKAAGAKCGIGRAPEGLAA